MSRTYDPYRAINDVIKGVVADGGHPHLAKPDVDLAHRGATMILTALGILPAQGDEPKDRIVPAPRSAPEPARRGYKRPIARRPHLDVQGWIGEFEHRNRRLPYGREVGGRFGRTPRWGRLEVRSYREARAQSIQGPTELWD